VRTEGYAAVSYRQLATRPMVNWALVAIGARLPVAMAPLALVFLVRDRPGGYVLGAALAAAYVLGEVAGAAVFGPRLNPKRARAQLAAGLGRADPVADGRERRGRAWAWPACGGAGPARSRRWPGGLPVSVT
jgi:hypothetical protein